VGKSVVSIWMVTYNHEHYIIQAIESVLMQITNFDFHLFIGEDCSTDNTYFICKNYADKYPDKITLFSHSKNIGAFQNAQIIYKACFESESKYVAMLEGDDYWTDPKKLQKQVDFLEKNIEYVAYTHNSNIINDLNAQNEQFVFNKNNGEISKRDALFKGGGCFYTNSILYRNIINFQDRGIQSLLKYQSGDSILIYLLISQGKVYYNDEIMSTYRMHNGGVYSSIIHNNVKLSRLEKNNIQLLLELKGNYNFSWSDIKYAIESCLNKLIDLIKLSGSIKLVFEFSVFILITALKIFNWKVLIRLMFISFEIAFLKLKGKFQINQTFIL
jgi:glycosyltransferase involved in cell wall biosynthesis